MPRPFVVGARTRCEGGPAEGYGIVPVFRVAALVYGIGLVAGLLSTTLAPMLIGLPVVALAGAIVMTLPQALLFTVAPTGSAGFRCRPPRLLARRRPRARPRRRRCCDRGLARPTRIDARLRSHVARDRHSGALLARAPPEAAAATMTSGGAGKSAASFVSRQAAAGRRALERRLGGAERTRVVVLLASVLALGTADASTVGASARQLRDALDISNTDIGLLVSVTSMVAARGNACRSACSPTGCGAPGCSAWDRVLGGRHDLERDGLELRRSAPGSRSRSAPVTAAAGPFIASLVGDYFRASERGRIYGFILAGELARRGLRLRGDGRHRRALLACRVRHPRAACLRARAGSSSGSRSRRAAGASR